MPTPNTGESRHDFVSRCVPIVIDDGTAADPDQAVAVCNSMWEEAQDKNMSKNMERKTFPGMVVKADEDQGIVDAFFAIFGNVDEGQDVMHPGAFAKTFSERGNKVRILDNHRTDSIMRAIGKPVMLKEVSRDELPGDLLLRHPDATGGAFASIQMLMDTPEGKGVFIRLRDKAVTEWSFGYDPVDFDFETRQNNGREVNVRNLRTVKLYEISPVLFAMNEATTTVGAKDVSGEKPGDDPDELKIGRAISAANMAKIQNVIDGIQSQLVQLERMLTGAQQVPDDEEDEDEKQVIIGGGRYIVIFPAHIKTAVMMRITAQLNSWLASDDKLIPTNVDLKFIKVESQNEHKAGPDSAPPPNARPDDAPPTEDREKALRELYIMAAEMQLSEV